eukprot:243150_1
MKEKKKIKKKKINETVSSNEKDEKNVISKKKKKKINVKNCTKDLFQKKHCDKSYRISPNSLIISKKRDHSSIAYLSNIIEEGVSKWKFRIIKCSGYIAIGVWKTNHPININTLLHGDKANGISYAFEIHSEILSKGDCNRERQYINRSNRVEGDIIEMTLNLNDRTIRYKINCYNYGIAFDNIEKRKYRAAICMHYGGDSIELLC